MKRTLGTMRATRGASDGKRLAEGQSDPRILRAAFDPDFDAQVAAAARFVGNHPNALQKLGQ